MKGRAIRVRRCLVRVAVLACVTLGASACAGFHSNQGANQVYTLEAAGASPGSTAGPAAEAPGSTLQVLRPLAAPGLDTEHIALQRDPQRLDYYAASSWPAPLPEFLQSLAVDALRATGKYRAVQADGGAVAAEAVVQLEIRRFQAAYSGDGPPVAEVQLVATFGRRADRTLIAAVSAEGRVAASENRMQAVVVAFQGAVDAALKQLAERAPAQF